jgi:Protein of unknown function (DUF2380)
MPPTIDLKRSLFNLLRGWFGEASVLDHSRRLLMFATSKYGNHAAPGFDRASHFRPACGPNRWAHKLARCFGLAAVVVCCWIGCAAAGDVPAASAPPIKIAVFAFELEDLSAAGGQEPSPIETSYLAQSTEEAKQQLLQSGRYSLIDTAAADVSAAKGQGLRNCGGCEAAIAMRLGADQALIGVVTKISMTEYTVRLQLSDAGKGAVISSFATDLRMGANYSWFRGVRWLMQNRLLASK